MNEEEKNGENEKREWMEGRRKRTGKGKRYKREGMEGNEDEDTWVLLVGSLERCDTRE